jgi:hypothetical protein
MPEPTQHDIQNAARRAEIASRQQAAYGEAVALALAALGPGYTPWMRLDLIPSDHRQTGNREPVATVVKVYRGEHRLLENSIFLRRMPDGTIRKAKTYEELFGELLNEKHPTMTVEVRGQRVPVGRWELVWGALETYRPRDAEGLAALRASREQKKAEREEAAFQRDNPLLAWAERVQKEDRSPER